MTRVSFQTTATVAESFQPRDDLGLEPDLETKGCHDGRRQEETALEQDEVSQGSVQAAEQATTAAATASQVHRGRHLDRRRRGNRVERGPDGREVADGIATVEKATQPPCHV